MAKELEDTLPSGALALQSWMAALALASLLYGAVLAWKQRDLKSMVAFRSIQGFGGGVLIPIAQAVMAAFFGG